MAPARAERRPMAGAKGAEGAMDPALRLKSYLLQEAEAVSRAAKLAWCKEHGVNVVEPAA